MEEPQLLAQGFETHRSQLRAVAYRMLGSLSEADDAVQESWPRLSRTDTSGVENLRGWLTTVTGRVCLDMLRSRKSRREDPLEVLLPLPAAAALRAVACAAASAAASDPEQQAVLADSVGIALLVVLETLTPAERLAFVLHDLFAVPFKEVAGIVGRSPAAARQLASRARRRVQHADTTTPDVDAARQREIVEAFLEASRNGEFDALLALLDPDAVLRVDGAAASSGASDALGAYSVASTFSGRAKAEQPAMVDGLPCYGSSGS